MTSTRSHAEGPITSAGRVLVALAQRGYVDASLVAKHLDEVTARLRLTLRRAHAMKPPEGEERRPEEAHAAAV